MQVDLKEKLPQWYEDIHEYDLCLTDDVDSLLSCAFLANEFWVNIIGFYTFDTLYGVKNLGYTPKVIGVDLDISKGKCFGNHVPYVYNPNAINLNNVISDKRYFKKYPCSTLMLILSLYDMDIGEMSEEQIKVILSIDSSFKGYYNEPFQYIQKEWYQKLGFFEAFQQVLDTNNPKDFYAIQQKYGLNEKIFIRDQKLKTHIKTKELSNLFGWDVSLPDDDFFALRKYKKQAMPLHKAKHINTDDIFSSAVTRKEFVNLSLVH